MLDLSIYVHIPFCESKCNYCSFVSSKQNEETINNYFIKLQQEIENSATNYKDYVVKTIYFGGGTPSVVNENHIICVLKKIKSCFKTDKDAEITIECNPNSLTQAKAKKYWDIGINRASVGLQSANNKLLKMLNRPHSVDDFKNAISFLKNVGFQNISVDILVGIPNQKLIDVKDELHLLKQMGISHISAYALMLEEGTTLFEQVKNNELKLPNEDKCLKYYDYVLNYLEKNNIYRYEVSNFAKNGFESKHNYVYWNYGDYLGFGLSAHSKIKCERFSNTESLKEYLSGITIKEAHNLTEQEQREEIVMLSLRTINGLNVNEFNKKFNCDLLKEKQGNIDDLLGFGLIELSFCFKNNEQQTFLKATKSGFSVLNSIILSLI